MSTETQKTTTAVNWGLLRAGGRAGGALEIPTFPTDVSTSAGPVRLAIGPNDEPRVLLPLADGPPPTSIRAGSALSICVSSFNHKGQTLRFLDLFCVLPDLETVFGEVVDEILARIAAGAGCVDAARSTIEDFRSLLVRPSSAEVDRAKVAGLIGELVVLNRLLHRSPSAWRAWRGPAGDRHDFRVSDTSLEVKATLRPGASTVTISSLEQLEVPTGGTLHLLCVVLEPVSSGILSVSGLGRNAMSKADDPDRLSELLTGAGCHDVDAEEWNRHRFRSEAEHLYEIRPGFPRLTVSMLTDGVVPSGVHKINYQTDLSIAGSFLCKRTVFADLEQRLCP